ncbi:alpha/beta fold hydrolase [Marinobacter xestospongiae]|uniref:alpha/beta fold hydrolase n=1 Tax=Marinobacter xestospongiae TaxID=994319 RepID=UPI003742570D
MIVANGGQVNSTEAYTTRGRGPNCHGTLLLAHGAGAPADSSFMTTLAEAMADQGVTVVRFDFPYMQRRKADGRKRPPDRAEKLLTFFREQVDLAREVSEGGPLFIGGKSMGGRMASLLASESEMEGAFSGAIGFGYPFHPPGKLDRWRTDHFPALWTKLCIIQGTRDPFGKFDEVVAHLGSEPMLELHWLDGGNHDFQPLKSSGRTQQQLIEEAASHAGRFIRGCD